MISLEEFKAGLKARREYLESRGVVLGEVEKKNAFLGFSLGESEIDLGEFLESWE